MSANNTNTKRGCDAWGRKVIRRRTEQERKLAKDRRRDPVILPTGLNIDAHGNVDIDPRYRGSLLD